MKLFILQEKLKEGLKIVEKISSKSNNLPILNNILFETQKNFLSLSSTDLEIGIQWWGLAKVEKEGSALLPSLLFSNFVNLLPNKQISIEKKENFLYITCEDYKAKIKSLSPEDFPIFPQTDNNYYIEINSEEFCESLQQVVEITSISHSRPEFTGIYIILNKDFIKLVATDSFRLGEKTIFLNKNKISMNLPDEELSFILPQKTAREIINIFKIKKSRLKMYISPNYVLFEKKMEEIDHNEIKLISRLIEGEYPSYQDVIPKKFNIQVVVDKNKLLNQLKTASLFSGKNNEITLKLNPKKEEIIISSQDFDYGEHQSILKGKIKGEEIELSFNQRFLIHGLSFINGSEIFLGINDCNSPVVLKSLTDQSYLYIVMPKTI